MAEPHPEGDKLSFFDNPLELDSESPDSFSKPDVANGLKLGDDSDGGVLSPFRKISMTTKTELFYDLFFVANLTVFTNVQEISSSLSLKQYIGFFSILWSTWYQVSLYDIRFTSDNSLFERIAKLIQFGVMIAIAVVGALYDAGSKQPDVPPTYYFKVPPRLRDLSLTLMVSRFVLFLQYLQVLFFSRKRPGTRTPLIIMAATYFVAGWIYFSVYWTPIPPQVGSVYRIYIAWYVVSPVESVIAITVPAIWRQVGFQGTHLTERMSLLTLIILGEGVIGLAEQSQAIAQGQLSHFTPPIVGSIISGLLILYFLFTLYFDWLPERSTESIYQKFWSILHFPFHLALVIAVEGIRRTVAWLAAIILADNVFDDFKRIQTSVPSSPSAHQLQVVAQQLHQSIIKPVVSASLVSATSFKAVQDVIYNEQKVNRLNKAIANGSSNTQNFAGILATIIDMVFESAGFEVEDEEISNNTPSDQPTGELVKDSLDQLGDILSIYNITFIYFFVTIGLTVLLCAILAAISSRRHKRFVQWLRIVSTGALGVALSLLALISQSPVNFAKFVTGPWILPTVALVLLAAFLINISRFFGINFKRGNEAETKVGA